MFNLFIASIFLGLRWETAVMGQDPFWLTVSHDEAWGEWGPAVECRDGQAVAQLKASFGTDVNDTSDNLGMYRLRAWCRPVNSNTTWTMLESASGASFATSKSEPAIKCGGVASIYALIVRVHGYGGVDNNIRATDGILFWCHDVNDPTGKASSGKLEDGNANSKYVTPENNCGIGWGMCGFQTMLQPYQGTVGDDMAITILRIKCCRFI